MGGHYYRDRTGARRSVVVGTEFDLVISLYQRDDHGPSPQVEHHYVGIPDGPLNPDEVEAVCRMADLASEAVGDGRHVLVRCHYGYNRSGLVIAQTLVNLGYSTEDAIFLIRRYRSRWALNNPLFVDYLNTGLDVTRLLTGLSA